MNDGKFIPKLHLTEPSLTYSACGTFTKHGDRIKKFKEKASFAHNAEYVNSKNLAKRTLSEKALRDYEIALDP